MGEVISQDQSVYSANNESVPLLYGSISAYRAFYVGMSDGADVGELTQDLIALGFGAGLTQSNHYSSATAAAVERWQRAPRSVGNRRDPARPGGLRARSYPSHIGHVLGRLAHRGRWRQQRRGWDSVDRDEHHTRSSPSISM